jgi:hypothetical protein
MANTDGENHILQTIANQHSKFLYIDSETDPDNWELRVKLKENGTIVEKKVDVSSIE